MAGKMGVRKKTEKPKNLRFVLKRLGRYLLKRKFSLVLALILTCASNGLALAGPMLTGEAIALMELGIGHVDMNGIIKYVWMLLLLFAVSSVLNYLLSILMVHISQQIVREMRRDVFDNLMELPVGYFDTHTTGDILSRISYDIDTVNTSLSTDFIQMSASIITVVGALAMMFLLSPALLLVFGITVPLSIIITKYLTSRTRPLFRARSEKLGEMNGYVEEMITGHKTIKSYHREDNILRQFDVKNKDAVDAYYAADYYGSIVGPSVNLINNLSMSLISVFGAVLYLFRKMSIGSISSFVLYSRKFSGPINEAANIVGELQSAFAAAERVFLLIDEKAEEITAEERPIHEPVNGDIEAENVSFGYNPNEPILKSINFHAKKGDMVAIVGPTGAGKTTIINLLMRFYETDEGGLLLDGTFMNQILKKDLRKSYAMVLQDSWLFSGSIYDNIVYGAEGADMEQAVMAAKAAGAHNYISRLPDGYNTMLNDDGVNISKGQKQLITIARAMLMNTKMLLLDEATSNVDTRTERQIQEAMRTLMRNKTCFVIAHRLSTIRFADLILVVKDGNIIEQGTHDELLGKKGFYHMLYQAQFD